MKAKGVSNDTLLQHVEGRLPSIVPGHTGEVEVVAAEKKLEGLQAACETHKSPTQVRDGFAWGKKKKYCIERKSRTKLKFKWK